MLLVYFELLITSLIGIDLRSKVISDMNRLDKVSVICAFLSAMIALVFILALTVIVTYKALKTWNDRAKDETVIAETGSDEYVQESEP